LALAKLGLGWSHLKLKDYDKARATFEQIESTALTNQSRDALYLGKAVLASETKDFQQAALPYDDLLVASAEPLAILQAYLGKAEALYNLGNYKDAIQTYREAARKVALESLPREMIDKLHYGLAWAYVKEGQFKEAIAEFQKIVKNTQDQVFKLSALCQIGDAYQDSGDFQKALATYEGILRDYPASLYSDYVQYQLGLVLLKLQNYDAAILSFSNLRTNFPDSKLLDDATYALGLAYFQKQDYGSSREIFDSFDKGFPESSFKPQALYLLGTSLYNLGRYADAIEAFKNIIRLYGQDTELVQKAEYEIADSFYQMGNEKEAMNRFTQLRAKYPDSSLTAEIMWWLGGYYYRQNDLALALRYFSSLIQDFPDSPVIPDAYYALGSVYAEDAKFDEAVANFRKVIELTTSDLAAQAAIAIADIYVHQHKYDEALELYREKATQYPNLTHLVYPKIGDLLVRTQKTDEALEFYRKALTVVPLGEKADMHFKVAETLQAKGKLKEAIEEYLNVTYLYPQDRELAVKSYLRVAQIFEDQENVREAMRIYEKVAGLDVPEAKAAREKLEALKGGTLPASKKE
ncbi:MAG: tetratricopeptide repeat protein, partial [Candidatus Omnitrophica bacterium]|nr:tetratricopeptide repeat protein [Candidatus Omnitrophota bacterium]